MLATVINAIALQQSLGQHAIAARVMTALRADAVAEPYVRDKALQYLEEGLVLLLAGGTGNPYFTTDTAAALRAVEVGAGALLKANEKWTACTIPIRWLTLRRTIRDDKLR